MLYLLHGNKNARKEAITKKAKILGITPVHIRSDDLAEKDIHEIAVTQTGLFSDQEMYIIHDLARTLDLDNLLPEYSGSENHFVFSEESITKPVTKKFEKYNAVIKDFGKEIKEKKQEFNMFSLTDALGARDRKNLWLLFQQAREQGSPEEIHGILFWQVKNLALVKTSSENPGMNAFVYKKTLGFADKFSLEEIQNMSRLLVHMFHNRDSYSTLDIDLEKFIMEI